MMPRLLSLFTVLIAAWLATGCAVTIEITEDGTVVNGSELRQCEGAKVEVSVLQDGQTHSPGTQTVTDGHLVFESSAFADIDFDRPMSIVLHVHPGQDCPYSANLLYANSVRLDDVGDDRYEISGDKFERLR